MSTGPGGKQRQSDWLLVGGAILVIVIFFGGYRMGMSGEVSSSSDSLEKVRSHEKATQKRARECNEDSATFTAADKTMQLKIVSLRDDFKVEQNDHDGIYDSNVKRSDAVTTCHGEAESQAAAWQEEDTKYKDKIATLTALNSGLVEKINALANSRGQPRNFLNQALDRVRWENIRMRIKLKMYTPEELDSSSFMRLRMSLPEGLEGNATRGGAMQRVEDEILEKYGSNMDSSTLTSLKGITVGENATYSGMRGQGKNMQFSYNKTEHSNVFLYTKTEDGLHYKRPLYFGRDGTNEIKQGVQMNMTKKYLRMATIPRVFRQLFNYALCAYRNNNRNITYPDVFLLKPPSLNNNITNATDRARLPKTELRTMERMHASTLFDTPLITFCQDCSQMANTSEFKLACLGDTVDIQYGSYDFWAMRSMLRWNPMAYESGKAYLEALGWAGPNVSSTPYVGVVYRTDARTLRECQRYRKPQRHYLFLARNQPANRTNMLAWSAQNAAPLNGTTAAPADVNSTTTTTKPPAALPMRKEPSCAVSYAELMLNMQAIIAKTGIKKFYISTKANSLGTLKKRVKRLFTDKGIDIEVIWAVPRKRQPEEQLTDLVVLESAPYLLVDAFSEHSQVVTESYLIRNEFNTDKLYVM